MDEDTLKALKGSIEKWWKIVNDDGEDQGVRNCPLCQKYHSWDTGETACTGCPVAEHIGLPGCVETPYETWDEFSDDYGNGEAKKISDFAPYYRGEARLLARKEFMFLLSLLPEGEHWVDPQGTGHFFQKQEVTDGS